MELALIIGAVLEYTGTVMIAFTALKVHHRVLKEHRVDDKVVQIMLREQRIGILGVTLLTLGFILSLIAKFGVE